MKPVTAYDIAAMDAGNMPAGNPYKSIITATEIILHPPKHECGVCFQIHGRRNGEHMHVFYNSMRLCRTKEVMDIATSRWQDTILGVVEHLKIATPEHWKERLVWEYLVPFSEGTANPEIHYLPKEWKWARAELGDKFDTAEFLYLQENKSFHADVYQQQADLINFARANDDAITLYNELEIE